MSEVVATSQQGLVGKYKPYPEYKDSGISRLGNIPSHWQPKKLKRMASIENGRDYKHVEVPEGFPVIGSGGQFTWSSEYIYNGESVLLGRKGTVDRPLYINGPFWTVDTMFYTKVWNIIPAKFLYYAALTIEFGLYSTNTALPSMTQEDLGNVHFGSPSYEEAENIAAFLDYETARIDRLIAQQQRLMELLKEKRQALISHAVTKGLNPDAPLKESGIEWLGQVPEHWIHNFKLGAVAEQNRGSFVNGPFGSDLLSNELTQEGVPVIYIRDVKPSGYYRKSTECVTPQKAKQLNVCKVEPGDVLVAKVGSPPGDACIYPNSEPEAIITQDVVRIRVNKQLCDAYYLSCLLNSTYGKAIVDDISVESTRKRFGLGDYKQLKIPLPPLDEQIKLASLIRDQCDKLDMLNTKAKCTIDLMQERRTALISAAVTGKIDLRGWTPPSDNEVTA